MTQISHYRALEMQGCFDTKKRRREFSIRWRWNLRRLKRIDPDWEVWFDAQPEQTCGEMLPLIMKRIEQLQEDEALSREAIEAQRDAADLAAFARGR
jgi:hypothetical protein